MRGKRSTVCLLTIIFCLQTPMLALAADVTSGSTQQEAQIDELATGGSAIEETAAWDTEYEASESSEFTTSESTTSEFISGLTSEGSSEFTSEFTEDISEDAPETMPEETSDLQDSEAEQGEPEQEGTLSDSEPEISNEDLSGTGDSALTEDGTATDETAEYVTEIIDTESAIEEGKRQSGFVCVGDDRFYLMNRNMTGYNEADLAAMATGWQTINDYVYYMDPVTGVIAKGFREIDGKLYYFNNTGSRPLFRNEWRTLGETRYYFNDDFTVQRGISTIDGARYYLNPVTGAPEGGFKTVNGRVYYFVDENYASYTKAATGLRLTGFNKIGGKTYFFITSSMSGYRKEDYASMATDWQTINGKKYRFEANGVMDTGWHNIDGYKYHFTNGVMDNAWKVIASKTYHFTDGKMDTGWKTICNRLYYFYKDGHMQETGRVVIDGNLCSFDRSGICTSKNSTIKDVVNYAVKWVGKIPYKSSATNTDPNEERKMELKEGCGSDCSWFVFNCLAKYGYLSEFVHSFEWGSKPSCYANAKEIGKDLSKAQPGDVICYAYGTGERAPTNSHVSIYIGNGQEVHCADGRGVIISSVQNSNIINIVRFSN